MNNKVSVICPVYNGQATIKRLIESVLLQNYPNVELIIIDGCSTDGTPAILEGYSERLIFISEPDRGIYDAMNKGIDLATGDWLFFMGADDYFVNTHVLHDLFNENYYSSYDILLGKTRMGDSATFTSNLNSRVYFYNSIQHQGIFYAKHIFDHFRYDITLTSNAEYELHLSLYLNHAKAYSTDLYFVNFSLGGYSSQAKFRGYKQEMIVRNKLMKNHVYRYGLNLLTLCRFELKKMLLCFRINLHVYRKEKTN